MFNKLQGQPESYDKKVQYKFGRTLGAGTYGIVREADGPNGKVAIKIILKKNVRGNEQMVYDELDMLQRLHHPHIVQFHDWFESRDKYYIVTQLATGGELFDRICEYGKFTEKDASQTILQVLGAVDYLHERNVVHRDLKPENLLYLTRSQDSQLVLADFGIAKMLDSATDVLTTMAGSFGYAAPEVMLKQGHGKAVDMWSLGVITYTLLCGYSPFRSENLQDLIDECRNGNVVFHERYWRDVSKDAKEFILALLQPDPTKRATSTGALEHRWLKGETATDHNLLPELKAYMAKARLKRGIEIVKLANRIEALKMQEEDDEDIPSAVPQDADAASKTAPADSTSPKPSSTAAPPSGKLRSLSKAAKSAIFREVVLAKVREAKNQEQHEKVERETLERVEKEKQK
ncbi:Calmodulin-dependent protein kinase cmk2 [Ophidiomyces ophidiicola]|nr:Calmodulin-dependent protein kinase cmk2 [Ophidiomyces ophidiicola]KAI1985814.1 Calmodulin-dependent protein kinase cmk2 [Ophidiomyces ophidiicola]KAI1992624.1 Calmodulin-dependent protein kinase cmk2 [Ophidiomyces ophidiicola]KAI1999190.1 Calmodulin-dependent protein kinase cmk2 [Ophidiomyces ophidiicola]